MEAATKNVTIVPVFQERREPPGTPGRRVRWWERRPSRRGIIFTAHAASGIPEVELTPECASKLGAAYGSLLPVGATVVVSGDLSRVSRMVERALIAGLESAGTNVLTAGPTPESVVRYYVGHTSGLSGGVHVRLAPGAEPAVELRWSDENGQESSADVECEIEDRFVRGRFRRAEIHECGRIGETGDVNGLYGEAILETVDVARVADAGLRLVVDYSHGLTCVVLPQILESLGCTVMALNNTLRDDVTTPTDDSDMGAAVRRIEAIMSVVDLHLGVAIDPLGDTVLVVDPDGGWYELQPRFIPPEDALGALIGRLESMTRAAGVESMISASA